MPRLAPTPLNLSETEREQLQQLVNRHSTPQQIAIRASLILLADEGQNHREIARTLNISRDMARLWRNRWLELKKKNIPVLERISDAPRPGGPTTFSKRANSSVVCFSPVRNQRAMNVLSAIGQLEN